MMKALLLLMLPLSLAFDAIPMTRMRSRATRAGVAIPTTWTRGHPRVAMPHMTATLASSDSILNGVVAPAQAVVALPAAVVALQRSLAAVRELPRVRNSSLNPGVSALTLGATDCEYGAPTFRRLFTHETWASYTGVPALTRWWRAMRSWRHSSLLRKVAPCAAGLFAYALGVAWLLPARRSLDARSDATVTRRCCEALPARLLGTRNGSARSWRAAAPCV